MTSLKKALEEATNDYFSPEKKRDAAKLLRRVHHPNALVYADMLEKEARLDEIKSKQFMDDWERDRERQEDDRW